VDIYIKILENLLCQYFALPELQIDRLLVNPDLSSKERIATVKDMQIKIYSNDHNPPHFHFVSKDRRINAKFLIETGEHISGRVEINLSEPINNN
jgi:hypothetical protein